MIKPDFNELLQPIRTIIDTQKAREEILKEIACFLKEKVYHFDWVGFYHWDTTSNGLLLGPYVGKPTEHTFIPNGKGVCGQVAEKKESMIIQDVTQEDNYIACSIEVQAEIVVPILKDGKFVSEIDIDSNSPAPFTDKDREFLEKIAQLLAPLF